MDRIEDDETLRDSGRAGRGSIGELQWCARSEVKFRWGLTTLGVKFLSSDCETGLKVLVWATAIAQNFGCGKGGPPRRGVFKNASFRKSDHLLIKSFECLEIEITGVRVHVAW